jgi:Mn2+/Fe2+ NRAMP family transporter
MVAAMVGGRGGMEHGGMERGALAALSAGVVAGLLIFQLVLVLAVLAPAGLIPDLAPVALTAADDLAQSRVEIQDPYVAVAFGAFLLAAALSFVAIGTRRRTQLVGTRQAAA